MSHFIVECLSGIVVASQKHTQTHLYSEGGGGRVGPTGGHIKAPQVKSYNTTTHDLFVRLADGRELTASFPFDDIAVRQGNAITLVAVYRADTDAGYYARLFNNDTRLMYTVLSRTAWRALVRDNPVKPLDATGESHPHSPVELYHKALAAFQNLKVEMAKGWHAAGDPNRELSPAELKTPLALELARAIEAALLKTGISVP